MSFSNMMEILQEKNKEKIVLIKLGVFYTAIGKDAVFFNKELGLKCVCYKNQVCKIGIPESVKVNIKLIKKFKIKMIEKFNIKLAAKMVNITILAICY